MLLTLLLVIPLFGIFGISTGMSYQLLDINRIKKIALITSIFNLIIPLFILSAVNLIFALELGKNALNIDSRQMLTLNNNKAVSVVYKPGFSYALNTNTVKRLTLNNNKAVSMSYILTLNSVNARVFSNTAIKHGDSEMMSKIKEMTEKSQAFQNSAKAMSNSIGEKNLFNGLKDKE